MPIDLNHTENLGPFPASPKASPKFETNFTFNFLRKYEAWNIDYQPFKLYPSTPVHDAFPSFVHTDNILGYLEPMEDMTKLVDINEVKTRPFEGMPPAEQFTIVMMTYKREAVLVETLQKLYPSSLLEQSRDYMEQPISPT